VAVDAALAAVGGGTEAGEFAEFVGHVGLVVVAAIQRYASPVDTVAGSGRCHDLMEAPEAEVALGSDADLLAETLAELARRPAQAARRGSQWPRAAAANAPMRGSESSAASACWMWFVEAAGDARFSSHR
jgi:hypothetical protein